MIEFTVKVRYDKHAGMGHPTVEDFRKELQDVLNEHVVADEIEIWDNDGEPALCSVTIPSLTDGENVPFQKMDTAAQIDAIGFHTD